MLTIDSLELIRMLHQVIWMSHKSVYSDVKGLSLWSKKNSNNDSSTGFQIKTLTSVSKDLWSEWYGVIFDPIRTEFQILLFFVSKFRCQRAVRLRKNKTMMLPLSKKVFHILYFHLQSMWFSKSEPESILQPELHISGIVAAERLEDVWKPN